MAAVGEPRTDAELAAALALALAQPQQPARALTVLFFFADFHEASRRGGALDQAFEVLAASPKLRARVAFVKCDAEALEDAAERFGVEVVPTFVFVGRDGAVVDRVVRWRGTGRPRSGLTRRRTD